eukprot:1184401-Rhodomonas_salina.1
MTGNRTRLICGVQLVLVGGCGTNWAGKQKRRVCTVSMSSVQSEKTGSVVPRVDCRVASSFRSCPLLKTLPSCLSTTTLTLLSVSSVSSALFSSPIMVLESAFLFLSSWAFAEQNHSASNINQHNNFQHLDVTFSVMVATPSL